MNAPPALDTNSKHLRDFFALCIERSPTREETLAAASAFGNLLLRLDDTLPPKEARALREFAAQSERHLVAEIERQRAVIGELEQFARNALHWIDVSLGDTAEADRA